MKFIIIGGSDAGIGAALRAKELEPKSEVTVVVRDLYPNFSICGIPFYLSGEVLDFHALSHRTEDEIRKTGIELILEHTAKCIDPMEKNVILGSKNGKDSVISYDKLLIGTGAMSVIPPIEGIDSPGVFTLRWMDNCLALSSYLESSRAKRMAIIGAGYIGMEMADALIKRGLEVTVIEYHDTVLNTMDREFGEIIRKELERNGVIVRTGISVKSIYHDGSSLNIIGSDGISFDADCAIAAVGVRPETTLGQTAGARLGIKGSIAVNRKMESSVPDIYAAGDCVETWHHTLGQYTYLPLGTTAHKQGRIAGENAVGGEREYEGTLGTQVVKIFDLVAARTGLNDRDAQQAGYDPLTVHFVTWDHKAYYPGAHTLHIKITGDKKTGKLLGGQIIGPRTSEISKRIDIVAVALYHNMTVEGMSDLDLSYTPPLSCPWDPVQMAAQEWMNKRQGILTIF
jgi:NADPH-dependent 2,4-dienoyl-CoA reductase/sulfur reductase-like enzyme